MAYTSLRMSSTRVVKAITCLLTWNLTVTPDGQLDAVHQSEKAFHLLHHADISDQADRCIILCRHHNSPIIYPELRAGHKPVRQEINV